MGLSKARIHTMLTTAHIGRNLVMLDQTDSTNRVAKALAQDGAVHGTVVVADTQTAGRGQKGRSFFSPAGCGLYISILLRHVSTADAPLLTARMGVAAARAIEAVAPVNVQIKWVNDLQIGGKKVAGILTEGQAESGQSSLDYAIVGIGINVCHVDFPDELKVIAGTVADAAGTPVDRETLLAVLLNEVETILDDRLFLAEYRRRSSVIGQTVTVTEGETVYAAVAMDIDDSGALLVERDGVPKRLIYGEVRVR